MSAVPPNDPIVFRLVIPDAIKPYVVEIKVHLIDPAIKVIGDIAHTLNPVNYIANKLPENVRPISRPETGNAPVSPPPPGNHAVPHQVIKNEGTSQSKNNNDHSSHNKNAEHTAAQTHKIDKAPVSGEPQPKNEQALPPEETPPTAPAEAKGGNNVKTPEKVEEIVDKIVQMILEKLLTVANVKIQFQHHTQPHHLSKDDKSETEKAQKDPQNANLSIPKEAIKPAADQPSFAKNPIEKQDLPLAPMKGESAPVKQSERVAFDLPKTDLTAQQQMPSVSAEKFIVQMQQINPVAVPAMHQPELIAQQHAEVHPTVQPVPPVQQEKMAVPPDQKIVATPTVVPNPGLQKTPHETSPYGRGLGVPPVAPVDKDVAEIQKIRQHQELTRIAEMQSGKHVNPRRDFIPNNEKAEVAMGVPLQRHIEEKVLAQMPIMPDLPLSREGILKDLGKSKDIWLRDDAGYRFGDLILMSLCAVICGAKNVHEIHRYLESKEKFFTTWLGLKNGMPTFRLLWWFFNRIDPSHMRTLLFKAVGKIKEDNAISNQMNVWESNRGIILGELTPLSSKKSQSTLLTEALEIFDLNGAAVTVEADTLSKEIARQIKWKGADYLLAIKGRHGNAYDQAMEFFESTFKEKPGEIRSSIHRDVAKEGNRLEMREITVTDHLTWFEDKEDWTYLLSAIQLVSEVAADSRLSIEKRLYLSSLPMDAASIATTLRMLTVLENRVEWLLDMDFAFNMSKGLVENEKYNIECLRQYSMTMLDQDSKSSGSQESKRRKALSDNDYLRLLVDTAAA